MVKKLFVEVCNAANLMPKDGRGSSNPYCVVDYEGQRRKTMVKHGELNPAWNWVCDFIIHESEANPLDQHQLEAAIYSEKKATQRRPSFLGRVRIPGWRFVRKGEEALMYYPLEKRSWFSHIKGELGLKVWWDEEPDPPPSEEQPPPPAEGEAAPPAEEQPPPPPPPPPEGENPPPEAPPEAPPDPPPNSAEGGGDQPNPPDAPPPPPPENPPPHPPMGRRQVRHFTRPSVPSHEYVLKETRPAIKRSIRDVTYDLVEKMHYLFVKVVKARALAPRDGDLPCNAPFVRINFGPDSARTRPFPQSLFPEWHEVFAFSKDLSGSPVREVSIWDENPDNPEVFLGSLAFDLAEIPSRIPPDSPLAPQWYRLEQRGDGRIRGDLMLAVWMGTQADEAFTEAWQSDSGGFAHTRSKVYLSPKLWYLRVNIIEAQEVQPSDRSKFPEVSVRVKLGFQVQRTRIAGNRNTSPFWNEDLMFVAAEPFEDDLILIVENQMGSEKEEELGFVRINMGTIERRVDHRMVNSRWFGLQREGDSPMFLGRLHLRICFDGGYHVADESANYSSCVRPTAKQLWKPVVGILELGIIRGKDLLPMKTKDGRGTTDAYTIAKYGQKWVRTRSIIDNLSPRWNEQYTWEVYDPCTVLSVGVFDNGHIQNSEESRDARIGKVRIRLSTLESDRIYTNRYPLLVLHDSGVKKMGEIELAVRFTSSSFINMMQVYFEPLLPRMHYLHPLGVTQSEILRISAMRIVAIRLSRSEPALRQEVVHYMLDSDSHVWSLRKSKVNYYRIMSLLSGPMAIVTWFGNICRWRNPITTVLVHILFVILVMYPELILSTLFLYMALIGAWHFRFRPRNPPSMDPRLSQAEQVDPDELDEEFDPIPTSKDPMVIKDRYDRLRIVAARIQNVLGDLATQGERISSFLSWRDPRATAIVISACLITAIVLYVVPFRVVVLMTGLYLLRHPRLRDPFPPLPLNFFRRMPTLTDRIL